MPVLPRKTIPLCVCSCSKHSPTDEYHHAVITRQHTANGTKISIMQDLLREDHNMSSEAEIHLYLPAVATADVDIDPPRRCSLNSKRISTLAKLAQSVLLALTTSASSEVINGWAGNLISSNRTSMGDVAIEVSLCAQLWGELTADIQENSRRYVARWELQNRRKLLSTDKNNQREG